MKLVDVLFVLGLFIGGVVLTFYGVIDYQERQSNFDNAVEVDGTIQSIEVTEEQKVDTVVYRPNITYTYTVNETQYTADTIYPGVYQYTKGSRDAAEEFASQYTVGETIPVFVNSQDPTEAFLKEEIEGWWKTLRPYLLMVFGGLMALLSAAVSIEFIVGEIKNSRFLS